MTGALHSPRSHLQNVVQDSAGRPSTAPESTEPDKHMTIYYNTQFTDQDSQGEQ